MANSTIGQVRVISGRIDAHQQAGRQAQGEVHSPDPTDTVSLGVHSDETGSGLFKSRLKVRLEDLDGNADLKVTIQQRFGRGFAVVTNTDGHGHETRVKVPLGGVSASAVENYFTPGGARASIFLDALQGDGVRAIEIDKDGSDGRITLYRTDGGNQGLTVGSTLTVWRA